MKTKIIIVFSLFSLLLNCTLESQQWINNYDFHNSYNGYFVVQLQFLNSNTGWVSLRNSSGNIKILKTVNKGNSWTEINSFNMYGPSNSRPFFIFTDVNVGYRTHSVNEGALRTILDKTNDGGYTWTRKVNNIFIEGETPLIIFKNSNEGFLYFCENHGGMNVVKVYKTYDGFESSTEIFTQELYYQRSFKLNDIFFDNNQNIYAIGHNNYISLGTQDYYRLSYTGSQHSVSYGGGDPNTNLKFLYGSALNSSIQYLGVESNVNNGYPGTRFYTSTNQNQNSILIDPQTLSSNVGGMSFSNNSKGFVTIDNKVYMTNNSGNNWNHEGNLVSSVNSFGGHNRVKSFGDVCYAVSYPGKFHTREISGNYNTMYDWHQGSGSIAVDGVNIGTPSSGYFRGGDVALYANQYIKNGDDTTAKFYYWGGNCNLSMNWNNSVSYLVNSGSQINADYKSKLKTISPNAFQNANQVKAVKDNNNVTNVLYESMGGLFYTRSLQSGQFKAEEVLSSSAYYPHTGYATFNNKNPYLSEVWNTTETEKNMWACWERRENNTIKILGSARIYENGAPELPKHFWGTSELLSFNAPEGFECSPKIFVAGGGANPLRVLTYLKPDGANKKIIGRVYTTNSIVQEFEITGSENIQEYAVAPIYPYYGITFQLHLVYRENQTLFYKSVRIGQVSGWTGTYADYYVLDSKIEISNNDGNMWRSSLDIALKNASTNPNEIKMRPVVTYQGRKDIRIVRDNGMGAPEIIEANQYPIVVKERLEGGAWSAGSIIYNSLNTIQQNPDIEGSRLSNACLLNFTRLEGGGSKTMQVAPRWNSTFVNTHHCVPNSFSGTDSRLINGSIINASSTSQNLLTLTQVGGSLFDVGTRPFTVTGTPHELDDNFQMVNGVVFSEDVKYSFNLSDITVNSANIGFSNEIDTTIDDSGEWNENMQSLPFLLSNNDTLIIGRNASYILEDPNGEVQEIEYWVNLINKTTNLKHRELAHDTLRAGDSLQIEYLEGFIIDQISGGSDSFYVRLEIDTIAGDFGIGGGIGGDDGGDGDNTGIKRKIFWENERPGSSISSNIPTKFELYQNYPNPFNPATTIKYDLPKDVNVSIKVYDLLGKQVDVLVNNETKTAGRYEVIWNALNYASGLYIFRIEAGDFVQTRKMVLLK